MKIYNIPFNPEILSDCSRPVFSSGIVILDIFNRIMSRIAMHEKQLLKVLGFINSYFYDIISQFLSLLKDLPVLGCWAQEPLNTF